MKLNQIINLKRWHQRKLSVGYGTRDKIVLKQTGRGKVYYLAKTYDKDIGELRSEVCASNIGRLFGFPVQRTWLCTIPQHKELGLKHPIGVLIQLDVRRQRDTRRGQFRENLIHGTDLISLIDKKFAEVKNVKEKRKIYTLDSAIQAIRNYVKKHAGSEILWEQFFELLVFDAIIGGTDRHYYNWGVLEKADNGKFLRLAPAFDNGVSLLWKMEEYRPQFMRGLHDRSFPRRAEAMFKKPGGGKYSLYEVLEALYRFGDYKDPGIARKTLKRICAVRDSRIASTILNNVPKETKFKTGKDELEMVSLYVKVRLEILKEVLSRLASI
ncbi:MAG TPA: HipA domain-containing protein [Candidatus Paceibacterota bacterium]|nr:HipA domain-containing protein [Candidatus Paceibacterota bacterium]